MDYDYHEMVHEQMYERMARSIGELAEDELALLARIFSAFEAICNERIQELASNKDAQGPGVQEPSS